MSVSIKIGDKVIVNDAGNLYTSYTQMYDQMKLSNPWPERHTEDYRRWLYDEVATVVAIAIHPRHPFKGLMHTIDYKPKREEVTIQNEYAVLIAIEYERPESNGEGGGEVVPFQALIGYKGLEVLR